MTNLEKNLGNPNLRSATRPEIVEWLPEPEAEQLFCPILSVDDHVLEPETLFLGRTEAKYADQVPRIEYDDDGVPAWVIDGDRFGINMGNGVVGRPMHQWSMASLKWDEFRAGVLDSRQRLADLDVSGIYASVCFPSFVWGFAGSRFARMKDPDVGLASLQAYNRWMIEEWCGVAPDRYVPCQLPWLRDPVVAAQEIYANAERGFKAVSFAENPEPNGFGSIHGEYWDPFFRACAETETVINLHVGSSGQVQMPSSNSPIEVGVALFPVNSIIAAVDWVYSRVAIKFPDIKVALSEGGASWVPMVLERLNRSERQVDASMTWTRDDPSPAELLMRNFWFASIEDPSIFRQPDFDLDHVVVEVDYPHADSTWPSAQEMVRGQLEHLDPRLITKLCYGNAAKLYRHPEPPREMVAASEVGARLQSAS